MRKVIFATCNKRPQITESDQFFADALQERGFEVSGAPWNGAQEQFEEADVIVLRSNWDYHLFPNEFAEWVKALDAQGKGVFNQPSLVLWNLRKGYLLDLQNKGIAIPKTEMITKGQGMDERKIAGLCRQYGWQRAVVKPIIGASGYRVIFINCEDESSFHIDTQDDILLQEFVPEISEYGEISNIFFNGQFSHAVRKHPATGDSQYNAEHGSINELTLPEVTIIQQAQRVLFVLPEMPLYARIDGFVRDGSFILMELEINEPHLFFELNHTAAIVFAEALNERL